MNNSFIPIVFKEKLVNIIGWFKGHFFFLISLVIFLSVFTFNINDDSFLTKAVDNFKYNWHNGSYIASFLIYSFG